MTVELLKRKYPIGTRVKIRLDDFIFGTKFVMATVEDYADNELCTIGDDGYRRWLMIGHDRFSVIYNEPKKKES